MSSVTDRLVAGRYRLGPVLGRGGMADVHEAFDERLSRPVAVKLLRPEVAARHPEVRARFEAEARNAACLSHPNVVAIYDTGEHEGLPFIVMELLPGPTLASYMARGPVDLKWLRRVAGDVLGALSAAHAAGIVHRDIKPGNILIGDDNCAKVADFGIAKSLEEAGPDLTGTNVLVGTPAYMAPERVVGEPATVRTDIYALGVVLYEAAAGRKPFTGTNPVALAYAIREGGAEPLRSVRPEVDERFSAAVEQAMAVDPATRFGSAAAMVAALGLEAPIHDGTRTMPVGALLPAAVGPPWWARREPRLLAAGLAALLLIGAVLLTAGGDPAPSTTDDATTTTVEEQRAQVETTAAPQTTAVERDGGGPIRIQVGGDDGERGNGKGKGRGG